jgi:alpha-tubulin suppressor-like RCC1 family protein
MAVAAGGEHTCSLRPDGTVVCWGSDATGQLGDGRDLQRATPHLARLTCP